MNPQQEIVIVGGGPAGAATALFACRAAPHQSDRILLLDRAHFPRDKICAGAIGGRAQRALERIGVQIEVPAAPVAGLRITSRHGALETRLPPPAIGRVVQRRDFDAALLERVREAGVEVREGVTVEQIERSADGVRLHTSRGQIHARAVVGADGVGSVVRRSLGLGHGTIRAQAVEVDTEWTAEDAADDLLSFDICDRTLTGYAWDFPTAVSGHSMVCRGVYRVSRGLAAAEDHPLANVSQQLSERLTRRGLDPSCYRYRRFAERGLPFYQPLAVDRVLLVGEAAGIDPVLGEGIAQAVLYGQSAGAYLAEAIARRDYRFGDYRSRLLRARVGLDLRVRAALLHFIYGGTRPTAERWVTGSRNLSVAGVNYFAGRPVPRARLWGAAADLLGAALAGRLGR